MKKYKKFTNDLLEDKVLNYILTKVVKLWLNLSLKTLIIR